MTRAATPIAITHRPYQPRNYAPAIRRDSRDLKCRPGIEPMDTPRDPRWLRIISFITMTLCTLYALDLWVVR